MLKLAQDCRGKVKIFFFFRTSNQPKNSESSFAPPTTRYNCHFFIRSYPPLLTLFLIVSPFLPPAPAAQKPLFRSSFALTL